MSAEEATAIAQTFDPANPENSVVGEISCDRWGLRFRSESVNADLALEHLSITPEESAPGEAPESFLLRDELHPGWLIRAPADFILNHGALARNAYTRHQIRQYQHLGEGKRRLIITAVVTGCFILVAALGALITPLLVKIVVARIPVKWERQLGDKVLAEVQKEVTLVEDVKSKLMLAAAVEPLIRALPQSDIEYRFYIIQDTLPNAFALPGGHVMVTTELLDIVDSPEELAAVVAHELAHVDRRHGFRKIVSAAGPYVIFKIFLRDSHGVMGVVSQGSDLLVRQSFSQEYELEADAVAWDYLLKANIDPRGLASMLEKLTLMQHSYGATIEIPKAFQSHPDAYKRVARLNEKWRKLPKHEGFVRLPPLPQR